MSLTRLRATKKSLVMPENSPHKPKPKFKPKPQHASLRSSFESLDLFGFQLECGQKRLYHFRPLLHSLATNRNGFQLLLFEIREYREYLSACKVVVRLINSLVCSFVLLNLSVIAWQQFDIASTSDATPSRESLTRRKLSRNWIFVSKLRLSISRRKFRRFWMVFWEKNEDTFSNAFSIS